MSIEREGSVHCCSMSHRSGGTVAPAGDTLFEVGVEDEGRDMWAVHLARHDWRAALRAARGQAQRNSVNAAAAEAAMAAGDARRAAELWGKASMDCTATCLGRVAWKGSVIGRLQL